MERYTGTRTQREVIRDYLRTSPNLTVRIYDDRVIITGSSDGYGYPEAGKPRYAGKPEELYREAMAQRETEQAVLAGARHRW